MSGAAKVVTIKEKTKKKKQSNRVLFWAPECKYGVILDRVKEIDWKTTEDEKQVGKVNVFWIDVSTIHEHFRNIQPWQCINHFPGMPNIARKNRMGQNLNKLLKIFPREYSFYPRTWILPGEMADFRNQFDNSGNTIGNKIYIIKPDAGCQGRGIYLTKTFEKVPLSENVVAQLYIKKPLLIDNFKFDLRLYCLVTSVKPLRVYLFHDGLVRMCTEEYVKPSKANLDQSCMHLTNYAVNKHNENFLQPDSDDGGEGSKRSLMWFMDWIREEHGDAKADWVWKRMGILCMRTLLSILPTLSREYDQHFKQFSNIPVDLRKISTTLPGATTVLPGTAEGLRGRAQSQSGGRAESQSQETDEDNSGGEGGGGSSVEGRSGKATPPIDASGNNGDPLNGEAEGGKYGEDGPQTRGSRCFEVLGYDIMLDSNLNPWLIEVNHLPSFGTDSVLDRDIKERLMEQVFSVLPAMPDDQQAYAMRDKAESDKRLNPKRSNILQEKREKEAKEKEAREKPRPPPRPRDPKREPPSVKTDTSAATVESARVENEGINREDAQRGSSSADQAEEDEDLFYEECTPERLQEMKLILYDVYKKVSPEKLNKIDKLLDRYKSHEEEFLRFVFNKYGVSPSVYKNGNFPNQSAAAAVAGGLSSPQPENGSPEGPVESSSVEEESPSPVNTPSAEAEVEAEGDTAEEAERQEEAREEQAENSGSMSARGMKSDTNLAVNRNQRETSKRASRSMSPPRSSSLAGNPAATKGRAAAAWKSTEQEDAAYRTEVLSIHVPKDDDEWLLFETSRLTQFTRIFPLPGSSSSATANASDGVAAEGGTNKVVAASQEEAEVEEQPDEEDQQEDGIKENGAKVKEAVKSATYEEIIFQAFLYDKRQTMRLRMPLPNRAKAIDDNLGSFLPPLDSASTSRSSFSTIGSGKGAVGWKAPPKQTREPVVRQPTQGQTEAAKRLSQGLSVDTNKSTARSNRYVAHNILGAPTPLAVVLDPTEYQQQSMMMAGSPQGAAGYGGYANGAPQQGGAVAPGNPYQPVYGGIYPAFNRDGKPEAVWPSTKANRLVEESRVNRLRLEAAKANSNAVVRQQVYYFDPNFRDQMAAVGPDGLTLIPPSSNNQQGAGASGGLLGGPSEQQQQYQSHEANNASMADDQGSVGAQKRFVPGNPIGVSARPLLVANNRGRPAPHVRHASTGNMNISASVSAATAAHNAGTSNHSQDELLRQLFPTWF